MNIATLYVRGADENLDRLIEILATTGTSRWAAGDTRNRGKVHESAGIQFDLADTATPDRLIHDVRAALSSWNAKGISLISLGLKGELSVGITVGDSAQFTAHIELSAADMVKLGSIGIALSIAAYPTSDEADELIA